MKLLLLLLLEEFIYLFWWKNEFLWELLNIIFLTILTTVFYFQTSKINWKGYFGKEVCFAYLSNFVGVIIFNQVITFLII